MTAELLERLAKYKETLTAAQLAEVTGDSMASFYKKQRTGAYDHLRTDPVVAPRIYSKEKIARWLSGDKTDEKPLRFFGRKRA
jgi:hypothetical protein